MHPYEVVSTICYQADRETRKDLSEGSVVSERDYMSTLSTRIRDAWKSVGPSYAYSKTLSGDIEQALGCDTLIVLRDDESAKVCLIEAKWPRVATKPSYKWDQLQKQKGKTLKVSHFSSQITRQQLLLPDAVVAEMFLLESPPGTRSPVLDHFGSTLVLQKTASSFDSSYRDQAIPWSNMDFWELMGYAGEKKLNLEQLVYGLASCKIGKPLPIVNGEVTIVSSGSQQKIKIPTALERLDELAPELCRRLGISNFVLLEVRWLG
ncbi:hypothetical protein ACVTTK_05540 [Alcaligenes nematophilus]